MNSNSETTPSKCICPWIWKVILGIAIIGLLAWFAKPNFIGGGPNRLTSIINELRQINSAKEYWAMKNGFTNGVSPPGEITQQDLAPLFVHGDNQDHIDRFGFGFDRNGHIEVGKDVVFSINPLSVSPEARLTSDFRDRNWPRGWRLPKGTIIRLGKDSPEEYILPGRESKPCKSLDEAASSL